MNRAERAAEYHKKGYNCAQAIVCAFCDKAGLDEETALGYLSGSRPTGIYFQNP